MTRKRELKDIQVMKADDHFDLLRVLYAENAVLLVNIKNGVGMFVYGEEAVNLFKHKLGTPSYDCGKEAYFRIRHKARFLPCKIWAEMIRIETESNLKRR